MCMDAPLTDGQARAVILAAEVRGFEREPELYVRWYDAALFDDAAAALTYLRERHPDAVRDALVASDPLPREIAVARLAAKGIPFSELDRVVEAAKARGFSPQHGDLPPHDWLARADEAEAAIAFLWEGRRDELFRILGNEALLAPIPETARWPCRCSPQDESEYY